MEFPITDLLDYDSSIEWVLKHFHPKGLRCSHCKGSIEEARKFRRTRASDLIVYRCWHCEMTYNLYTGTIFQGTHWTPKQVVLLMRGISKGETTKEIVAELELSYKTVLDMRHKVHANAEREQPETPLPDSHSETDEMFQNAGEKRNTSP